MSRRTRLGWALWMALLSACGGGGGGGGPAGTDTTGGSPVVTLAAEVYPLASGDRRSWRTTAGTSVGAVRSERVGAPVTVASGQAFAVASDDGSVEYLQRSATGVSSVSGPDSDALTAAIGAVELLRFGAAANQTIVTYNRTLAVDLDADGRADSLELRIESTFLGYETVDTATARHAGAAHVRTVLRSVARLAGSTASSSVTATSDDWYAPGIGPVRNSTSTVGNGGAAQTTAEEVYAWGVGSVHSESVAPVLQSSSPVANAYAAPTVQVTLNFSEPVDPLSLDGSGGIALVNAAGATVPTTRALSPNGQTVTLAPRSPLADGRYEVRAGSGVTDLANNALAASVRAFTVDTERPRVVGSSPADGAAEVPLSGVLKLVFNEPIFAFEGRAPTLRVQSARSGAVVLLPAVIQGNEIAATLAAPLERNATYYLSQETGLTDANGNTSIYAVVSFRTDPGPLARPATLMEGADVGAVALGDIDGNGRADLVFIAQQLGSSDFFVGARLQQANGTFAAPARLYAFPAFSNCTPRGLLVADVDADGRADIAVTGCGGLKVLRQQPGGGFVSETAASDIGSFRIASVDLDGNGRAALVTGSAGQFQFLRRSVGGGWTSVLSVPIGSTFYADVQLVDLDGDGRRDLVWLRADAAGTGYELAWALRQGNGFGTAHSMAISGPVDTTPVLTVGDVTGDGRPDVILSLRSSGGDRIAVLRQTGNGFDAPQSYASAYGASVAAVGDLDGDGRLDLVVTHSTLQSIGVYLQGTDSMLQAERLFESSYHYYEYTDALVLVDLNADGRLDIVADNDVILGRPFTGVWPLQTSGGATASQQAPSVGSSGKRALRGLGLMSGNSGGR